MQNFNGLISCNIVKYVFFNQMTKFIIGYFILKLLTTKFIHLIIVNHTIK